MKIKELTLLFLKLVLGLFFVFSGSVKLIDPLGTSYKLEEYFGTDVFNFKILIPFALTFAIILIVLEIILGVLLLIGTAKRTTLIATTLLTLFFLTLTWYSAYFDKVNDCGCFGDFLKISPWQTFYKNVVVFVVVLFLWFTKKLQKPLVNLTTSKLILTLLVVFLGTFTYYTLHYLPIVDFRPFKVGTHIPTQMNTYTQEGLPVIHDFYLESETEDLTPKILTAPKVLLICVPLVNKLTPDTLKKLHHYTQQALKKDYLVYLVSGDGSKQIASIQNNIHLPILYCDNTTLKTMIRANPGFVVLHHGTIQSKNSLASVTNIIF